MKKFLRFIFVLILIFMFAGIAAGEEVKITFGWDCNTEPDLAGYRIFQRAEGHNYSFTDPAADVPCTVLEGSCSVSGGVCEYEHTFDCPEEEITFYWVLRAYDTKGYESGNSNEVQHSWDLASINPAVLTAAVLNDELKQIEIAFTQEDIDRVSRWELYSSNVAGGPYTKVDTFQKSELSEPYVATWGIHENGKYHFVLVTFTTGGKFSGNSNEVVVEVTEFPNAPTHMIIIKF